MVRVKPNLSSCSRLIGPMVSYLFLTLTSVQFATLGTSSMALTATPDRSGKAAQIGKLCDVRIGQVPELLKRSTYLGPMDSSESIFMSLSFQVNDESGLLRAIHEMYDPASPGFHQ